MPEMTPQECDVLKQKLQTEGSKLFETVQNDPDLSKISQLDSQIRQLATEIATLKGEKRQLETEREPLKTARKDALANFDARKQEYETAKGNRDDAKDHLEKLEQEEQEPVPNQHKLNSLSVEKHEEEEATENEYME